MIDLNALVEEVHHRCEELGMDCSVRLEPAAHIPQDASMALRWGASRARFAVHVMESVRMPRVLAAMASAGDQAGAVSGLVIAPWISPAMGRRLTSVGVAWADSVGNMSVRFGTVIVEVSGRPRPPRVERPESRLPRTAAPRAVQLLTPANARVVDALVDDPDLGLGPLRELASVAGVSLGQAHKATSLMAAAGYHRDRLSPAQLEALRNLLAVAQSRP